LIKICVSLKDYGYTAQKLKEFPRAGTSEIFGGCPKKTQTRNTWHGRPGSDSLRPRPARTAEILLVTVCWVRKVDHTQTYQLVGEISRNSSVVSWSHHARSLQSHPPTEKQCAYSVVNVFAGNVTIQLSWGGKLYIRLEARNTWIPHSKKRKSVQAALSYRRNTTTTTTATTTTSTFIKRTMSTLKAESEAPAVARWVRITVEIVV